VEAVRNGTRGELDLDARRRADDALGDDQRRFDAARDAVDLRY
jgi:hypothetical protein